MALHDIACASAVAQMNYSMVCFWWFWCCAPWQHMTLLDRVRWRKRIFYDVFLMIQMLCTLAAHDTSWPSAVTQTIFLWCVSDILYIKVPYLDRSKMYSETKYVHPNGTQGSHNWMFFKKHFFWKTKCVCHICAHNLSHYTGINWPSVGNYHIY